MMRREKRAKASAAGLRDLRQITEPLNGVLVLMRWQAHLIQSVLGITQGKIRGSSEAFIKLRTRGLSRA